MPSTLLAAADAPAGGAAIDQVIIATAFGLIATAVLAVVCIGHRAGRIGLLAWGGRLAERLTPLAGWAVVPGTIALVTLPPTLFGLQWDESLHIGEGRDEGPLANPSHYILLQGIFGAFIAGVVSLAMADDRVPASGIRLPGLWRMPIGGVLATAGAAVAMLGFPLDDVWHRLFGQDVTLWSPTHVTMIAGVSIAVFGIIVLMVEGARARGVERIGLPGVFDSGSWTHAVTRLIPAVMLPAALLLVLSLLQGEYDFGVAQYQLLFHPMIVMAAAGTALVSARIFLGPGAAIAAALAFVAIRGVIALIVGPVFGEPDHVFPLYIVPALAVEGVALLVSTRRPLRFGLAAGALIGSAGLAAEWAWSGVFPYEWTSSLLPEGAILGFAMAIAGSVLGAWIGTHLELVSPVRSKALRNSAVAASAVITALIFWGLQEGGGERITGSVELTEVRGAPERTVGATITLDPPDAAADARWIAAIAWQGGGLISEPLERIGEGVYRTDTPLPVHGSWKSVLRLHTGDRLLAVPVFLPEDAAIPAEEVPAPASFEREFVGEKTLLQREAKEEGGALIGTATVLVAAISFGLLGLAAFALHRLALAAPGREAPRPPRPGPRDAHARSPHDPRGRGARGGDRGDRAPAGVA